MENDAFTRLAGYALGHTAAIYPAVPAPFSPEPAQFGDSAIDLFGQQSWQDFQQSNQPPQVSPGQSQSPLEGPGEGIEESSMPFEGPPPSLEGTELQSPNVESPPSPPNLEGTSPQAPKVGGLGAWKTGNVPTASESLPDEAQAAPTFANDALSNSQVPQQEPEPTGLNQFVAEPANPIRTQLTEEDKQAGIPQAEETGNE